MSFFFPKIKKRKTREIRLGKIGIGGEHPVRVQTMSNLPLSDLEATLKLVHTLYQKGCEIIRVAIPNEKELPNFKKVLEESPMPVVADIHFTVKLAEKVIKAGVHGIRINPGTFRNKEEFLRILSLCKDLGTCVRIGINAGSLEKKILEKYKKPCAEAMVESALRWLEFAVEKAKFENLKVSLKSSSWWETVRACRLFSEKCDFPLHIGVTEAGGLIPGTVKNTLGVGILLFEGIGDTIRISLTDSPEREIEVAYEILKNLGLRRLFPEIISCPTCGRCEIDLFKIYQEVYEKIKDLPANITVAIMGCVVNGPGEAKEADLGIAGGKGKGILFKKGKVIKQVPEKDLVKVLLEEIEKFLKEHPERWTRKIN